MALLDETTEFADAVSVAAAAGTALVGDVIDTGGDGFFDIDDLYLVIEVDTAIITGGSAGTLVFKLSSDAQAAIATDGTATDHFVSASFVTGSTAIAAGSRLVYIELPKTGSTYERYLGVLRVIGTTTTTAGKVNAYLTKGITNFKAFPDATN